MTPERVRELLQAATPGPWHWRNTASVYLMSAKSMVVMAFGRMGMQGAQPQFRDKYNLLVDAGKANLNDYADAQLIAAAPEIAAAYLALVDEFNLNMEGARWEIDSLRAELQELKEDAS